jgi:hypothetical protein
VEGSGHCRTPIMKIIVMLILVAAAAGGYLYLHPEVIRPLLQSTPIELPPAETTLYKWRDATGQWQVSDTPPEKGIKYEILHYRGDINVVPAVPVKKND